MIDKYRWCIPFLALILLAVFPATLRADPVLPIPGVYALDNHPNGGQSPPYYGLRLDGLLTPAPDVYTFSFSPDDGASMAMLITDMSLGLIRITGTVFGGKDVGGAWTNPSFFSVDFSYLGWTPAPGDDDIMVPVAGSGSGSITQLDSQGVPLGPPIALALHGDFRLGNGDDDLGYQGFAGISGWGALTHGGGPHVDASEWMFKVVTGSVPEPGSLFLVGSGLVLGLVLLRKSFRSE